MALVVELLLNMTEDKYSSDSKLLREALSAYLEPLLKKHEASELIFYEDLDRSNKAAETILSKSSSAHDAVTVG